MITKISILSKYLNKSIRVISSLVIALAMAVSSMAFVDFDVIADNEPSGTYYEYEALSDLHFYLYNGNQGKNFYYTYVYNNNARIVGFKTNNVGRIYLVSDTKFTNLQFNYASNTTDFPTGVSPRYSQNYSTVTVDGVNYYVANTNLADSLVTSYDIPFIDVDNVNSTNNALAISYTYGENAVGPSPEIVYGNLKDLTFSSSIVGSGNGTGEANKDTISWYPYSDSNNKSFGSGGSVEIRVVPGDYISSSQEGIFTQTYTDFVLDVANAGHLATVPAYNGTYSINWGTVMQKLSASWPALELLWDGEYWKKLGWVYQVRYQFEEDENTDNWSEWQTVYNITSSTPSGTDGLDPVDGTAMPGFYENIVDAFNTTSVVNNNSNITYYVNNIQYTVNQTPETPGSDVTNDLLREIRNITIQIRQLIVDQNNDGDEKDPEDTGLNDKDKELHDKEKELIDDMDDKLNDIDTDVDLITTDGFLGAAQWVRAQYDHLTLNTPFELVIVFALVLGIGLIFIGKVR